MELRTSLNEERRLRKAAELQARNERLEAEAEAWAAELHRAKARRVFDRVHSHRNVVAAVQCPGCPGGVC